MICSIPTPVPARSTDAPSRHEPAAIAERLVPHQRRRGRGAATNASGRFETLAREAFDDGWTREEAPEPLKTEVTWERPKTIITRNDSPDVCFDRSINPYRGCEHGCIYCYARPTHAYMGLSPGLDFESKLFFKHGAAELLERELAAPTYAPRVIALRRQHRSLPAARAAASASRARCSRCLQRARPSVQHRHQVGPGPARSRHSERHGARRARQGLPVGDDARPRAGTQDGAARADAREADRSDREAERGRRAGRRDGRAGHPGDQRPRDRGDSDPRPAAGAREGGLCRAAPAARAARHVPRMAAGPLPGSAEPGGLAHAVDAQRQGLRGKWGPAWRARDPTPG